MTLSAAEVRELVSDAFKANGLESSSAAGLAAVATGLAEILARDAVIAALSPLRATVFGWALLREMGDDGGENVREAARRLHCQPRVLRREQARIRRLLSRPCPPVPYTQSNV